MATMTPPDSHSTPMPRPRQNLLWSRLHFVIRLLGLTGALIACAAAVLAAVQRQLVPFADVSSVSQTYDVVVRLIQQAAEAPASHRAMLWLLGGVAVALFAVIVEAIAALGFSASRRSIFGFNALLQSVLAIVLFIGINVWSYYHYQRLDYTRDGQFTLPAEVRAELSQLDSNSKTTVIVYQRHNTFASQREKNKPSDEYESAAGRKIVDKVKDLAEQFAAVGTRIDVQIIDTQDRNNKEHLSQVIDNAVSEPQSADESEDQKAKRLKRQSEQAASLRKAIESAPENSLFFYARGGNDKPYIQRLSFNDLYLLDKTASQEDRDNRGNLVLLYQGVRPFANRLLRLEEKRPRIALAVVHPVLSSIKDHDLGLRGLRQALESRGFQVEDIVLKKWSRFAPPTPAAATVDESDLERIKERQKVVEKLIADLEGERPSFVKALNIWKKASEDAKMREELTRKLADQLRGRKLTPEIARFQAAILQANLDSIDDALPAYRQRLAEIETEKNKLNVPALEERQRMSDIRAKMERVLADCDLLIVPRMTLRNLAVSFENIPNRVYKLDEAQVEAIKDFLKAGKPMLACFGPINASPEEGPGRPGDNEADGLEKLLAEVGFKLGKETVLFDAEIEALADSRASTEFGGTQFEIPPVLFDWTPGTGRPEGAPPPADKPNRIRDSLRLIARGLGKNEEGKNLPLDLRIRHPRPIYFVPSKGVTLDRDTAFLMTNSRSWNEDQPFPTADSVPQFEKPKKRGQGDALKEASKDPYEKRRRGPFPIGVAVETELPSSWYGSAADKPAKVRLAVIGQGGFFSGKKLPAAEEELFVSTIDWLLGRDDRLPRAERTWSYPRVNDTVPPDSEREYLWLWGVRLGLPILFAYLGVMMLLFRRLR